MGQSENQRLPRVQTSLEATLVNSDGDELSVKVTNLSSNGFRLSATKPLTAGTNVSLRVVNYGDFPAHVRWVKGCEAGGTFREPVLLEDGDHPVMDLSDGPEEDRRQAERRKETSDLPVEHADRREADRRERERRSIG